jgi:uncharacterized protein YdeI (YjbR/CyaY-like superfamily)
VKSLTTIPRKTNLNVDAFICGAKKWRRELEKLRAILLDSELTEEFKWRQPCYTLQGKPVIILHGLKESCAFALFKGSFLKDVHGVLTKPGPNTQAGRWIKFTSLREIAEMQSVLKAYTREAIEVEKAGLKLDPNKKPRLTIPEEFQRMLDEFPSLKSAFDALTPGRKRAYVLYFSAPKQSKTREARVQKCMPHILDGKGFNER